MKILFKTSKTTTAFLISIVALSTLFLPLTTLQAATITNGMDASYVLGQEDFTSLDAGLDQESLSLPIYLARDSDNDLLFVSDRQNNRILVFDLSEGITNGMDASYVLGQEDFTSNATGTTASTLSESPSFISYDDVDNDYLFVSDSLNYRVLVFDLSEGITNGMSASYVLGQDDFVSSEQPTVSDSSLVPNGTVYDPNNDRLFVVDGNAYRVLVFDLSEGITNGMSASYVLGQDDFDAYEEQDLSQATFVSPESIAYDTNNNYLFVGDNGNNRVLVFDLSEGITNGMDASYVLGQESYLTNNLYPASASTFRNPYISYDSNSGYLLVGEFAPAAGSAHRVLIFDLSEGITNGMSASYVLGQDDFTTTINDTTQSTAAGHTIYDSVSGEIYVAHTIKSRIMIFADIDLAQDAPSEDSSSRLGYTHPPLCTTTITPSTITKGEQATLSWNIQWPTDRKNTYYTKVPGEGLYTSKVQSITISPQHTTTYRLATFNLFGANFCETTITVQDEQGMEILAPTPDKSILSASAGSNPFVRAIMSFFSKVFVR